MRILLVASGGALALAGCAPVFDPPAGSGIQRCDLDAGRGLVGSHVGAVSFPQEAEVRIVCTTCPTTRDYRPDRLNVRFDQSTGVIESVDCG